MLQPGATGSKFTDPDVGLSNPSLEMNKSHCPRNPQVACRVNSSWILVADAEFWLIKTRHNMGAKNANIRAKRHTLFMTNLLLSNFPLWNQ
jgi:hypothetical protein